MPTRLRGPGTQRDTLHLSSNISHSDWFLYSKAPITPATAASKPPALIARLAAELADELELLELLDPVEVPVLLLLESSVAVAVAEPDVDWAALPVALTEFVEAYWLARAQYCVTWPCAEDARTSSGQLL